MANENLCDVCKRLIGEIPVFSNSDKISEKQAHHQTLDALVQAGQGSCELCELILHSANDDSLQKLRETQVTSMQQGAKPAIVCYNLKREDYRTMQFAGHDSTGFYDIFLARIQLTQVADSYSIERFLPIFIDDGIWDLVGRWMRTCSESHWKCRSGGSWLPTRLIDVGQADSPYTPRLCLRNELLRESRYVTLSHCWGELKILRLLMGNLESMRQSIPWKQLCKTFQEAIIITRRVGVQYLWIDSLCIVQDSTEDWEKESAMMGMVYAKCCINIAASTASDGSYGFFGGRARVSSPQTPFKATINRQDLPTGTYLFLPSSFKAAVLDSLPLDRRAWVYQERLLSPRTLHFANDQLFWECKEIDACESLPEGIPQVRGFYDGQGWKDMDERAGAMKRYVAGLDPISVLNSFSVWNDMVQNYSTRSLTYGSDKLVAIAGPARALEDLLKSQYFCGLWRVYLPYQLLWWTSSVQSHRAEVYRAPSWSWASIDGQIQDACRIYDQKSRDLLCCILDVQVASLGDPFLGKIQAASIRMQGKLALCQIQQSTDGRRLQRFDDSSMEMIISGRHKVTTLRRDVQGPYTGRRLHCMPVQEDANSIRGLILEPVEHKNGQFRRFGMFQMWPNSEIFNGQFDIHLINCEETNGIDQFRFTII